MYAKVAALQMNCDLVYSKEKKNEKALKMLVTAAEDGANIILLPELFNIEYAFFHRRYSDKDPLKLNVDPEVVKNAEPIPGPTTCRIAKIAQEYGIYVIPPLYEKVEPGIYYNSAPVIGPDGDILGVYRKTHLAHGKALENLYFKAGSEFPVFNTKYGKFGIVICFDSYIPETWRILALNGAEIIFSPNAHSSRESNKPPRESFEFVYRTRCIDNRVFGVICGRTGVEKCFHCGEIHYNYSFIINPQGDIISRGKRDENEIISASLDLEEVNRSRMRGYPYMDLRPELYKRLVSSTRS